MRRSPQFTGALPVQEKFPETLDGRGVLVLLPNEYQRNELQWLQKNEVQPGVWRNDGFGHHADASASLDVAHDGADQAGGVDQPRAGTGLPEPSDDRIMESHAFSPREHHETFPSHQAPGHTPTSSQSMIVRDNNTEALLMEENGVHPQGLVHQHGTCQRR